MAQHRPKFITVKLADLTSRFNDQMVIPISREFAENMFLVEVPPVMIKEMTEKINLETAKPKPTIRVIENLEEATDE